MSEDLIAHNRVVGADNEFNKQKHGYVLTFPWNYPEVIKKYEQQYSPLATSSYWHKFMDNTRSVVDFNNLFREFHQFCALPDQRGLDRICEPKLASYVGEAIKQIHFHGLDIEMANLTVEQPSIRVLKAEVHQGLDINRAANLPTVDDYHVSSNHSLFGADWKTYVAANKDDQRHVLDVLDTGDHRPYLVQLTCLIESPMKMFVYNQNHSAVLFGSDDPDHIKNVVKFEANLRWFDFFNLLPVENKKQIGQWRITDFNHALNENPLFEK